MSPTQSEETHLRVLRLLEANPELSQRELAEALGVSLGKTNYCLKALLDPTKAKGKLGWTPKISFDVCGSTDVRVIRNLALTGHA